MKNLTKLPSNLPLIIVDKVLPLTQQQQTLENQGESRQRENHLFNANSKGKQ